MPIPEEEKIKLEFDLKTPYFIISSPEKTLGQQYLISSAKKSGKTLLFWNRKNGFQIVCNNDTIYSSVNDILFASLEQDKEDDLRTLSDNMHDIRERCIPRFVLRELHDQEDEDKETVEKADLITALMNESKEDAILLWWAHAASPVLHNVCLVLDGDFMLMADLMQEVEQHQTENPAILLTTKEVSEILSADDNSCTDDWIYHTQSTPILQVTLDSKDLKDILCETLREHHIPVPSDEILQSASRVLLGIKTKQQARNLYSRVIVRAGKFGKKELVELFKLRDETVGKYTELLSPVYVDEQDTQLGGMDLLKEWVTQHKSLYTPEAKKYGLHPPKGLILCGPPGTGKTACAKYIAYELNRPLIVFNVDLAFKRYVGESEYLLKKTFDYLDSLGDVVILLDEISRFLGENAQSHESTRRITAAFLTWQTSRANEVFVIAASNSLSMLPPEFTRAGRFDKIYYVDLPGSSERVEILNLHLKKRNHGGIFGENDLQLFSARTGGFSGAELESVVETALLDSYLRDKHLRADDILLAIQKTKPLSFSRLDEIKQQRINANEQASPASSCSYESELASRVQTNEDDIGICYC